MSVLERKFESTHRIYFTSEYGYEPEYKTKGSAGADLRSGIDVIIEPKEIVVIPTGLKMSIPEDCEGQVRMRSGLAKKGLIVVNAPGTIDSDYCGKIGVVVSNISGKAIHINKGDRIAQLVIAPIERVIFMPTDELRETERGEGGFGSTGVK